MASFGAKPAGCIHQQMAYQFESLNVLVVEDNYNMLRLLTTILKTLGIRRIMTAQDGSAALELANSMQVDVMFVDYLMEPMDGLELTRQVRTGSDSPNAFVPIIMVTGHATPETVAAARNAGVTEFLVKPVSVKTVAARLVSVIEHPRPFVRDAHFFGPDRRRRVASFEAERRQG